MRELGDELLIYDLDRHKVYCLNRMAMQVFRHCDGETTIPDMARRISKAFGAPVEEEAIQLGLARLQKARLLEEGLSARTFDGSRRDMLRRLGKVAVLVLPVVTALTVPTSAHAASCPCNVGPFTRCSECQPNQRCGPGCRWFCRDLFDGFGPRCVPF
jgi:hypothetical protein